MLIDSVAEALGVVSGVQAKRPHSPHAEITKTVAAPIRFYL